MTVYVLFKKGKQEGKRDRKEIDITNRIEVADGFMPLVDIPSVHFPGIWRSERRPAVSEARPHPKIDLDVSQIDLKASNCFDPSQPYDAKQNGAVVMEHALAGRGRVFRSQTSAR